MSTIYCGSGKKTNKQDWFKVNINPAKFAEHVKLKDGKNMLYLNVNIKEEADQYGKDLSVTINDKEDYYEFKGDNLCGGGKAIKEDWLQLAIETDLIKPHVQEFKGHKFIKLNLNVDDSGVRVSVDTWKPEDKVEEVPIANQSDIKPEDLPF